MDDVDRGHRMVIVFRRLPANLFGLGSSTLAYTRMERVAIGPPGN